MNDTLRSGWLTAGPKVRAFEAAVAGLTGGEHAVALGSATQALHLTLAAFGGLLGKEVITTPYTFVATAEAILQAGATRHDLSRQQRNHARSAGSGERSFSRDDRAVL